ncbi:MAG: site-specific DNA-methyltransferase [Nonlabens sp.]
MNKKDLLHKLKEVAGLSKDEKAYLVNLINTKKKYGLVWEDKPEDVEEELRSKLPILKEVKERAIINDNVSSSAVENGSSYPNHILIEGDNLHALTALTFTHENKIDLIYIDPPYNTGNKDFIYNDKYVDKEDSYRHSKWISFMSKRLKIAHNLLADDGVIFISIDDNEQPQLRILCDEIFGQNNFVSNMIWAAGKKNDSKHISNSHEYIICYFKSYDLIKNLKRVWSIKKEGIDKIYKQVDKINRHHKQNYKEATVALKKWYKELPNDEPAKRHKHYSVIDERGVFFPADISWPGGGGPQYDVLHPLTKKPVNMPSRGWVYSSPERMQEIIDEGKVYFGDDENKVPTLKTYLKDREKEVPYSVFYQDGRSATKRLRDLLGKKIFNNPKDENIIGKIISFASDNDSLILDFFAGSGTTLHATMELNNEDNGNRKCILVTNNENKIAEEVTYERNKRVIQGYEDSKGNKIKGLKNNNLRYYKTDFVARNTSMANKRKLTKLATELLCIKEDCYTEVTSLINKDNWNKLFTNGRHNYIYVIYDDLYIDEAVAVLTTFVENNLEASIKVYVFSNGTYPYSEEFEDIASNITLAALPDAIYKAYQNVLPATEREEVPQLDDEEDEEASNLFNTAQ